MAKISDILTRGVRFDTRFRFDPGAILAWLGDHNGVHDPKITNTSSRFTRDPDISPLC